MLFSTYLLTYYFCTESEDPIWIAIFYSNFTPFWYLLGPFLYFYVRNTISDNSHFRKGDYLHFLPFLIHLINMVPYLISPFSYKMEVAKLIIADFNNVRLIGRISLSYCHSNGLQTHSYTGVLHREFRSFISLQSSKAANKTKPNSLNLDNHTDRHHFHCGDQLFFSDLDAFR